MGKTEIFILGNWLGLQGLMPHPGKKTHWRLPQAILYNANGSISEVTGEVFLFLIGSLSCGWAGCILPGTCHILVTCVFCMVGFSWSFDNFSLSLVEKVNY